MVVARTDSTVAIDDTFIPALDWYARAPVYSTTESTLREFLADPIFLEIERTSTALPGACTDCRWRHMCRGGDIENRFSTRNGFDNPSIYCDAYKVLYQDVCDELIRNGFPADIIEERFTIT
jgi:uncharacterized protein